MNDAKAKEVGAKIVEMLGLKLEDGKVRTVNGAKTPTGLARMLEDLIMPNEHNPYN